jgi:hypothetical protein
MLRRRNSLLEIADERGTAFIHSASRSHRSRRAKSLMSGQERFELAQI